MNPQLGTWKADFIKDPHNKKFDIKLLQEDDIYKIEMKEKGNR